MESMESVKLVLQPHRPRIFFRPYLLLMIFCLIFLQLHPCLSGDTISAGHSIAGNQTITSKGGIFQLGYFFRGSPARYYIGIWYTEVKDEDDNVVWVANRDTPLQNNIAELKISEDGSSLVIQTKSGSLIWSTNSTPTPSSHPAARVAVLQNNGNLALMDGNSSSAAAVWESFDHPTDTFLPGGRLGRNNVTKQDIAITSWKNKDDPSSGFYSQKINPDGQLELPLYWNNTYAYWTTGVWNGQFFTGIPEMRSINYLYNSSFVKTNDGSYYTYMLHDSTMLTKTKIHANGQIKQETWQRATQTWSAFWTQPIHQCDIYALCGPFGVCNNQVDQNICECLDGFNPASAQEWESNVWSGGCTRKNGLQCEGDGFISLSVKSSSNHSDSATISGGAEGCRLACLGNCSCTAYSYQDGTCSTWKGGLLNLVKETTGGTAVHSALVRVPISPGSSGGGKKHSRSVIIVVTVTSLVILLAAAGSCYFWKSKGKNAGARKQGHASRLHQEARKENGGPDLPFYRLRYIMAATDNFSESNKLGQGGFGPVYRGELQGGQEVAIKRLSRGSKQGLDEFTNEVKLIAKLQHVNLVQLLGCCAEGEERILIYEYMPNKSLDHFLFDPILRKQLDWDKRLEIVTGIARGLQYLHQESRLKVIHRDLKASNILLDSALNPRISDFGLARIFGDEQSHISTNKVAGTWHGSYGTRIRFRNFLTVLWERHKSWIRC
ncbi:putative serine/threonine-protein kinase receptor isoform X2 [Nymphaea colorata]|uniref:putative serine/threonine-protein kinase receptor isoform X2 n=1 Tax=Nymphaea colorata TaxID=210225 RepID=UPI00129DD1A4|nr:putative serine/threonine-protein kinase receptor isoform X2 [Nymphaea colorata]